jgi:hypothetical protein
MAIFTFGLSSSEPAISPDSDLWSAPLPASRHAFGQSATDNDFDVQVTYGDYFSAARNFLMQNNSALLCGAINRYMDRPVSAAEFSQVAIYLVKHGAFYHPSYIKVQACGRWWHFVLNVAVSSSGQKLLIREFQNLDKLNRELNIPYWPLVFGRGGGRTDGGRQLPMFLGQWLDGFHEFHLTAGSDQGCPQVVVWDVDRGQWMLTGGQVQELMRQAACILAYAYNPLTFEAVLDWHHAAGDFVINTAEQGLSVRLITVRKYAPIIEIAEPDVAALLEALLIYLVNISLRLRLDRLDGTNQMACHPPAVIPAICQGFLQGLNSAAALRGLPEQFSLTVKRFLVLHGSLDLMPIAHSVAMQYAPGSDERHLLKTAAEAHVSELAVALSKL